MTHERSSSRAMGTAIAWAWTLAIAGGVAGCSNPFLPSQPESPSSGVNTVSVAVNFSTPELLLYTLSTVVSVAKDQGNGVQAYLSAFADSSTQGVGAHFDFDPEVVADQAGAGNVLPAGGWTVPDHERAFYSYLFTLNPGEFELSFSDTLADEFPDDNHRVVNRRYSLTATSVDFSTTDFISVGWARIAMQKLPAAGGNPERWVITRWSDHVLDAQVGPNPSNPGLRCFSRLRIDSFYK